MSVRRVTDGGIDIRFEEHIAFLRLNRPEAMNAMTPQMVVGIGEAIAELPDDLRVLVITGSGGSFCAGSDLGAVGDSAADLGPLLQTVQGVFGAIRSLPFPVLAGVNGLAVAGGLELALCADIVVAAGSAVFGDGHANYGVVAGAGNCAILPRVVGPVIAKYLQFTGLTLSAADMQRAGLVAAVWDEDSFSENLAKLADRIAGRAPLALRHMKRLSNACATHSVEEVLAMEIEANAANSKTDDMREGLAAFAEKRRPVFQGG